MKRWGSTIAGIVAMLWTVTSFAPPEPVTYRDLIDAYYHEFGEQRYELTRSANVLPPDLENEKAALEKDEGVAEPTTIQPFFLGTKAQLEQRKETYGEKLDLSRLIPQPDGRFRYDEPPIPGLLLRVPPRTRRYGADFKRQFDSLGKLGVPVVLTQGGTGALGETLVSDMLTPQASAILRLPVQKNGSGGHLVVQHELRHIRNNVTDVESYLASLPPLPASLADIVRKSREGGMARLGDWRLLARGMSFIHIIDEARASEGTFGSLVHPSVLAHVVFTPRVAHELWTLYSESRNVGMRNSQLIACEAGLGSLKAAPTAFRVMKAIAGRVGFLALPVGGAILASKGIHLGATALVNAVMGNASDKDAHASHSGHP